MKASYLIQRLKKPSVKSHPIFGKDNPFSFGGGYKNGGLSDKAMEYIGEIFQFDYMGAAEFEWGAVPEALSLIAKMNENLVANSLEVKTKNKNTGTVYYLCGSDQEDEIKKRIKAFAKDEWNKDYRTKEYIGLRANIDGAKYADSVGWLELNNGYFFFTDKEMWTKTCTLFGKEVSG